MKKVILFLMLLSSYFVNAQSLKEALYGGKLKNEPGTVIKKGDDLSTKIDTARKVLPNDSLNLRSTVISIDSASKKLLKSETLGVSSTEIKENNNQSKDSATLDATSNTATENAAATKDNNAAWKNYITSISTTLKNEVLPSKKIRKGNYYVSVSYTIGTDGQVAINNVLLTPENSFLQQQIKDRVAVDAPRLSPVLSGSGVPRKVNKNYNFTLVKE